MEVHRFIVIAELNKQTKREYVILTRIHPHAATLTQVIHDPARLMRSIPSYALTKDHTIFLPIRHLPKDFAIAPNWYHAARSTRSELSRGLTVWFSRALNQLHNTDGLTTGQISDVWFPSPVLTYRTHWLKVNQGNENGK